MKPALLEYLVCVECAGSLRCDGLPGDGGEILEGTLTCGACGARFPVRRGVPRMLPGAMSAPERATSRAFGTQWKMLGELSAVFTAEFESYLAPLSSSELRGLRVLDAGCGMGKFSLAAAQVGARAVVAVDLSEAVDVAYEHLKALPNAHVVQASIYRLPFRPGLFEFIFSIGVLHHLPDPEQGFRRLLPLATRDGRVFVWLYAYEGNERFVRWLDPLRAHVLCRLPSWVNRLVATALAVPLWGVIAAVYVPLAWFGRIPRLPYAEYFLYFWRLGFPTFWGTVYDKLVPPVAFYLTRDQVRRWVSAGGLTELHLRHRNGNSWACLAGRTPST